MAVWSESLLTPDQIIFSTRLVKWLLIFLQTQLINLYTGIADKKDVIRLSVVGLDSEDQAQVKMAFSSRSHLIFQGF